LRRVGLYRSWEEIKRNILRRLYSREKVKLGESSDKKKGE